MQPTYGTFQVRERMTYVGSVLEEFVELDEQVVPIKWSLENLNSDNICNLTNICNANVNTSLNINRNVSRFKNKIQAVFLIFISGKRFISMIYSYQKNEIVKNIFVQL